MSDTIKYQAQIDRTNRNNSHTLALDFALTGTSASLKILEVGCSAGYFGSALKQLGHYVCGVEMDPVSSKLAINVLNEVHCCTVQEFFQNNSERQFDLITFGDVLEHLAYPAEVLIEARKHLTPSGRVVCSVPNVGHASVRCMLMQGDWDYAELGILDKTHLRFFTKKTLIELFDGAGFLVQKVQAVRLPAEQAAQMCGITLRPEILQIVNNVAGDDTLDDFQYVLSATPKSVDLNHSDRKQPSQQKRALRVLATTEILTSSIAEIRLRIPLQSFADEGCRIFKLLSFKQTLEEDVLWADVIVIQRGAGKHAQQIAEWCLQNGRPFVYEIDDLLIELPDFLSHHLDYIKNKTVMEKLIRQATAVTVTNENLKSALNHLSDSIWVCPNYHVQLIHSVPLATSDPRAPTNLIIASSDKIRTDFVSPALAEIKKRYGSTVEIIAIGPIATSLKEQGVDCLSRELISYEDFIPSLSRLPNVIGIIPLDDSKFSSCKSSVKFLDFAVGGIASICSNVAPYRSDVTNGVTGLLVNNTTQEWVQAISSLIDHPERRDSISRGARETVMRDHNLQLTTDAWSQVFAEILPNSGATSFSGRKISIKSTMRKLKEYLRQKNYQRKARRRQLHAGQTRL